MRWVVGGSIVFKFSHVLTPNVLLSHFWALQVLVRVLEREGLILHSEWQLPDNLPLKKWGVPAQMTWLTDLLTFVSVGARFPGKSAPCFNSPVLILRDVWAESCAFCPETWSRCSVPGKIPWRQSGVFLWLEESCDDVWGPVPSELTFLNCLRRNVATPLPVVHSLRMYVCESCSVLSDSATTWTVARPAPLFVGFSRQES